MAQRTDEPGAAEPVPERRWKRLSDRLAEGGRLIRPDAEDYAAARLVYSRQFDTVRPQALARCRTVGHVRAAVEFARAEGIGFVLRSGGHSSAGYSTGTGLVIDLSGMDGVELRDSPTGPLVAAGPGTQFVDLVGRLAPHGLAVPGGMNPSVALGGYLQGGGFGLLTRRFGMGCDQLVEADVLLADGRTATCSATRETDLFWALRGAGGGNLGVVTGYRLRTVALESVVNYTVNWPWQHAAAVLAAWQEWVVSGAAELGSSLLIVLPNAAEDAVPIVTVIGMHAGEPAQAERELSRFAALVGHEPSVRACAPLPYQKAIMQWYGGEGLSVRECHVEGHNPDAKLPRGPWQRSRNRLLDSPVPEAALQEILDAYAADRRAGHTRVFNAFALGGTASEVDRDATAYVHRDAFAMFGAGDAITGAVADDAEVRAGQEWADRVFDVVDRYSTGESYQNYIDSALPDWQHAYYGGNYARLQEIKRVYDPDRVFDFAQAIGR